MKISLQFFLSGFFTLYHSLWLLNDNKIILVRVIMNSCNQFIVIPLT